MHSVANLLEECMKGQICLVVMLLPAYCSVACYTSVAQCQRRQEYIHRDSGLERRHPVSSLYSRETKECSLFIFIKVHWN